MSRIIYPFLELIYVKTRNRSTTFVLIMCYEIEIYNNDRLNLQKLDTGGKHSLKYGVCKLRVYKLIVELCVYKKKLAIMRHYLNSYSVTIYTIIHDSSLFVRNSLFIIVHIVLLLLLGSHIICLFTT